MEQRNNFTFTDEQLLEKDELLDLSQEQIEYLSQSNSHNIEVNVFIEISKGSRLKMEYNKEKQRLVVDRKLRNAYCYQFHYGEIEYTFADPAKGGDNDPLDACVFFNDDLPSGCMIKCKILGALFTSDEHGIDYKFILVPANSVDVESESMNSLMDINIHQLNNLQDFFTNYKSLEKGKHVTVGRFINRMDAEQIYCQNIYFDNSINFDFQKRKVLERNTCCRITEMIDRQYLSSFDALIKSTNIDVYTNVLLDLLIKSYRLQLSESLNYTNYEFQYENIDSLQFKTNVENMLQSAIHNRECNNYNLFDSTLQYIMSQIQYLCYFNSYNVEIDMNARFNREFSI